MNYVLYCVLIGTVFMSGAALGSFVKCTWDRLHTKPLTLFRRSHCVQCQHTLQPADLIPLISAYYLQHRCRYCNTPFSRQLTRYEWCFGLVAMVLAALPLTDALIHHESFVHAR